MKGPGVRLDLDLRRLWTCPQCGQSRRLHAWVTAVRCASPACDRDSTPTWLKLVADRPPLRTFPTPEKICIPEPIELEPIQPEPIEPAPVTSVQIEPATGELFAVAAEPVVRPDSVDRESVHGQSGHGDDQIENVVPAAPAVTTAPVMITPPGPVSPPPGKTTPIKAAPALDPLDDWPDFGDPK